jgi:hypothetical protein
MWLQAVVSTQSTSPFQLCIQQALLGDPLPRAFKKCQQWFGLLKGTLIWNVWIHQNQCVFEGSGACQTQAAVACKAWAQYFVYISLDFRKLKVKLLLLDQEEKQQLLEDFEHRWCAPPIGPHVCLQYLDLPAVPSLTMLQ